MKYLRFLPLWQMSISGWRFCTVKGVNLAVEKRISNFNAEMLKSIGLTPADCRDALQY